MEMDLKLAGKVAMVGGGSRGLGLAIAKGLAAEGAKVSIASRSAESVDAAVREIQASAKDGANIWGTAADLRTNPAIEEWYRGTLSKLGPADILVANTGGPPAGKVTSFDDAAWTSAYELLLLSVVRLARLVTPGMIERRRGSILIMTSSSVREPIPNLGLSNVIRPAVAALAKSLALELAPHRIRVNHLIPGRIATDRVRELDEIGAKREGISLDEQRQRMETRIPLGRYGQPDEFANAAVYLLSDAASYITGATLQVDGGMIRAVI
jgi:3-oxoacyl-[acyl-carrier protein] reductase